MNPIEQAAQAYIDAIADPQCFCDGRLLNLSWATVDTYDPSPNCPCRHQCKLFGRQPTMRKPIRRWRATKGLQACQGYESWEQCKKDEANQEQIEAMAWQVTMLGRTFEIRRTTIEIGVMLIMVKLRREGEICDNEIHRIVRDKDYSVREL